MKNINAVVSKRKIQGQGMTEYIIIVALIAIAAIGVFTAFGGVIRAQVSGMASELSGGTAKSAITTAATNAKEGKTQTKMKGLKGYNGNKVTAAAAK